MTTAPNFFRERAGHPQEHGTEREKSRARAGGDEREHVQRNQKLRRETFPSYTFLGTYPQKSDGRDEHHGDVVRAAALPDAQVDTLFGDFAAAKSRHDDRLQIPKHPGDVRPQERVDLVRRVHEVERQEHHEDEFEDRPRPFVGGGRVLDGGERADEQRTCREERDEHRRGQPNPFRLQHPTESDGRRQPKLRTEPIRLRPDVGAEVVHRDETDEPRKRSESAVPDAPST
jgi:hypothetical protein